jgi:hypothetical protein
VNDCEAKNVVRKKFCSTFAKKWIASFSRLSFAISDIELSLFDESKIEKLLAVNSELKWLKHEM